MQVVGGCCALRGFSAIPTAISPTSNLAYRITLGEWHSVSRHWRMRHSPLRSDCGQRRSQLRSQAPTMVGPLHDMLERLILCLVALLSPRSCRNRLLQWGVPRTHRDDVVWRARGAHSVYCHTRMGEWGLHSSPRLYPPARR